MGELNSLGLQGCLGDVTHGGWLLIEEETWKARARGAPMAMRLAVQEALNLAVRTWISGIKSTRICLLLARPQYN